MYRYQNPLWYKSLMRNPCSKEVRNPHKFLLDFSPTKCALKIKWKVVISVT